MPEKFKASEKKALVELNLLQQFLTDCCVVEGYDEKKKEHISTSWTDIGLAFKQFCKQQSIKPPTLSYTYYNGVFSRSQIKVVDNPMDPKYEKTTHKGKYALGMKLSSQMMEQIQYISK